MKNIRYNVVTKNSEFDEYFQTIEKFWTLKEAQEFFEKLVEEAKKNISKDESWRYMIKHNDVCAEIVWPTGYEIIKIEAENLAECFVLVNVYK